MCMYKYFLIIKGSFIKVLVSKGIYVMVYLITKYPNNKEGGGGLFISLLVIFINVYKGIPNG